MRQALRPHASRPRRARTRQRKQAPAARRKSPDDLASSGSAAEIAPRIFGARNENGLFAAFEIERGNEMGLLRMAARTAVVAGTATAVSGRVQRRQAARWDEQDAQQYAEQQPQYQQAPPAAAPEVDSTAQLQNLAQLHAQGVLTAEEFAAAKAKILGI
jgi:Short C-terminal domain